MCCGQVIQERLFALDGRLEVVEEVFRNRNSLLNDGLSELRKVFEPEQYLQSQRLLAVLGLIGRRFGKAIYCWMRQPGSVSAITLIGIPCGVRDRLSRIFVVDHPREQDCDVMLGNLTTDIGAVEVRGQLHHHAERLSPDEKGDWVVLYAAEARIGRIQATPSDRQ